MSVRAMKWAYGLFEVIDLAPADRAVLLALCWDHTDAGGCYPSQERVSLLSGYRRRKIADSLNNLEDAGIIKRNTTRKGGKFQQTTYTLFGVPKVSPRADGGARRRVHKKAHGDRVQTGAQYRGSSTSKGDGETNVVPFPVQQFGSSDVKGVGNV